MFVTLTFALFNSYLTTVIACFASLRARVFKLEVLQLIYTSGFLETFGNCTLSQVTQLADNYLNNFGFLSGKREECHAEKESGTDL